MPMSICHHGLLHCVGEGGERRKKTVVRQHCYPESFEQSGNCCVKKVYYLCVQRKISRHTPDILTNSKHFVAYDIKKNIHMLKIIKQVKEIFQKSGKFLTHAQNFRTHCGNFEQTGNLLCHMTENKYNIFVQSKFSDTCQKFQVTLQKFVPIQKFSNTRRKFPDTRRKP